MYFGEYYHSKNLKTSLAHDFFLVGTEVVTLVLVLVPGLTAGH